MKKLFALLMVLCVLMCSMIAVAETAAESADTAETTAEAAVSAASETENTLQTETPAEETEEADPGIWTAPTIVTMCVLVAAMIGLIFMSSRRVKWNASMIAKAAMAIALAYVLSMVRLFRMPQGGSVTLISMLPLILLTLAFGPMEGLIAGFAFGILQLLLDPYVIHPIQLLVDYPFAYGAVALAYAAVPIKNEKFRLPVAALLGYFGRLVMAVLSGVVFFAEYAGEQNAFIYSLVYNISYLGPEALICAAVMFIPGMERLVRVVRGNNMK